MYTLDNCFKKVRKRESHKSYLPVTLVPLSYAILLVMFYDKKKYSLLSRAISVLLIHAFFLSNLAWAAPTPSNPEYSLARWTANEDYKIKREALAKLYRDSRLIWLANSPRYLDLLARHNALTLLLPSGRYLMAPETAANDLALIRSATHEDNEILMQKEEERMLKAAFPRRTRYYRLREQILNNKKILKAYHEQLSKQQKGSILQAPQGESLLAALLSATARRFNLKNKKNRTKEEQAKSILFNDLIACAFELLFVIDEHLVCLDTELNAKEREFVKLMRPILEAKDSLGRYKNFSQVFFDINKRARTIRALQWDMDERFYRVANSEIKRTEAIRKDELEGLLTAYRAQGPFDEMKKLNVRYFFKIPGNYGDCGLPVKKMTLNERPTRTLAEVLEYSSDSVVIVPRNGTVDIGTKDAYNCPLLIMRLKDTEDKEYLLLSHIHADFIDRWVGQIITQLKRRRLKAEEIIFSPRHDSEYKTAETMLKNFIKGKILMVTRGNDVMPSARAVVSNGGWMIDGNDYKSSCSIVGLWKAKSDNPTECSDFEQGNSAALLRYMFANGIDGNNALMPKDMAKQRGDNDSLSNIYRELVPLERAGIVEGGKGNPRHLADWVLGLDPEEIIRQNPELNLPALYEDEAAMEAVAARVKPLKERFDRVSNASRLPSFPYQEFQREVRGGTMPLAKDELSAHTAEALHLGLLLRDKEGGSYINGMAKDSLEKYFDMSYHRGLWHLPNLGGTILEKRIAHPLLNIAMIDRSHRAIQLLLAMPIEKRRSLYNHIKEFYRYLDDYRYTWHHYRVDRSEYLYAKHLYTKSIFYLAKMLEHIDIIRDMLTGEQFAKCLRLPRKINDLLRDKNVSKVREHFAKYPPEEDDIPGRNLDWHREGIMALEESRPREVHRIRFGRGDPLTPFWQGISGVDMEDEKVGFTPALQERIDAFKSLEAALRKEGEDRIAHLPERVLRAMEELFFALGGTRMVTDGHYAIPRSSEESGIIHLEGAWNPVAGKYEEMDKMDIDLGVSSNFFGITGANEIGKSTTIEMIALCVLYFQMGLPIPARAGNLGIFRNIYTATPGFEELEPGESQHTRLVKRLTELIKRVGPRDLVIIDEAHMGSDYKDLTALTAVLMQDLIITGATVVYATHLKSAMKMLTGSIPHVKPQQIVFAGDEAGGAKRELHPGIAEHSLSIKTLENLDFPPEIIEWTKEYYDAMTRGADLTAKPAEALPEKRGKTRRYPEKQGDEIAGEAAKILFPDKNFYYGFSTDFPLFKREDIEQWCAVSHGDELKKALFEDPDLKIKPDAYDHVEACVETLYRMHSAIIENLQHKISVLRQIDGLGLIPQKDAIKDMSDYIEGRITALQRTKSADAFMIYARTGDAKKPFKRVAATDPGDIKSLFERHAGFIRRDYRNNIMQDLWRMGFYHIDFVSGVALSMRENDLHFVDNIKEGEAFSIKNARSPFIPGAVPIDFTGDSTHPQFIITGPNKSGKTSATRTLQALMYLARLNLPVPAEMRLPPYDNLLTFFGGEESMVAGESYFKSVARHLGHILEQATPRSLIIMDELHGSDYWELSALQAAIIKYLDRRGATVVFNTHMREGLSAANDLSSIKFLKTEVTLSESGELIYHYSISEDPDLKTKSYGIETVREHLSPDQYKRALEIREKLAAVEGGKGQLAAPEPPAAVAAEAAPQAFVLNAVPTAPSEASQQSALVERMKRWSIYFEMRNWYHRQGNNLSDCSVILREFDNVSVPANRILTKIKDQVTQIDTKLANIYDRMLRTPHFDEVPFEDFVRELQELPNMVRQVLVLLNDIDKIVRKNKTVAEARKCLNAVIELTQIFLNSINEPARLENIDLNEMIKEAAREFGFEQKWEEQEKFALKLSDDKKFRKFRTYFRNIWPSFFRNFFDNAKDHAFYLGTPGEFKEDWVISVTSRIESDSIVIVFGDNGVGMPEEALEIIDPVTGRQRVFTEQYTRNDKNTMPWHGLGLALCWDVVRVHGGTINVQSESGKGLPAEAHSSITHAQAKAGTTFTIRLPLVKEPHPPTAGLPDAQQDAGEPPSMMAPEARMAPKAAFLISPESALLARLYDEGGYFYTLNRLGITPRKYHKLALELPDTEKYLSLDYEEAKKLVENPTERKPYGVFTSRQTAKNLIFATLDTIPGFKEAREANDIAIMADLYRKHVIKYKAKDRERYPQNGQLTFFCEVGGLAGFITCPRPYLRKTSSPAELLRLAIPGLIDEHNPSALKPLEVEKVTLDAAPQPPGAVAPAPAAPPGGYSLPTRPAPDTSATSGAVRMTPGAGKIRYPDGDINTAKSNGMDVVEPEGAGEGGAAPRKPYVTEVDTARALSISSSIEIPSAVKAERQVRVYLHNRFKGILNDEDIRGICEMLTKNFRRKKNKRSKYYTLKKAIDMPYRGRTIHIAKIYLKGIMFDARKPLLLHEGDGKVDFVNHVERDGMTYQVRFPGNPDGAAKLPKTIREFLITDDMFFNLEHEDTPYVMAPFGWASFPGVTFRSADGEEQIGCGIFGIYEEVSQRIGKLPEYVEFAGQTLARLHLHGVTHPFLHYANMGDNSIFDLDGSHSVRMDDMTEPEFFARRLCDLDFVAKKYKKEFGRILADYLDAIGSNGDKLMEVPGVNRMLRLLMFSKDENFRIIKSHELFSVAVYLHFHSIFTQFSLYQDDMLVRLLHMPMPTAISLSAPATHREQPDASAKASPAAPGRDVDIRHSAEEVMSINNAGTNPYVKPSLVGRMFDLLGINAQDKILFVGQGTIADHLIAGSLKGADVDVAQPEYERVDSPNSQTGYLERGIYRWRREIERNFGSGFLTGKIDLTSYRDNVEDCEIPRNHYSYVLILNVLEIILNVEQKNKVIDRILSSLRDNSTVLISVYIMDAEKEISIFISRAEESGYKVERSREVFNTGTDDVHMLKITRDQTPVNPAAPQSPAAVTTGAAKGESALAEEGAARATNGSSAIMISVDAILSDIEKLLESDTENKEIGTYFLELKLLDAIGVLNKRRRVFNIASGLDLFPGFYASDMWTFDRRLHLLQASRCFRSFLKETEGMPEFVERFLPQAGLISNLHHFRFDILDAKKFIPTISKSVKSGDIIFMKFVSSYLDEPWAEMKMCIDALIDALPAGTSIVIFEDKPSKRDSNYFSVNDYLLETGLFTDQLAFSLSSDQYRRLNSINEMSKKTRLRIVSEEGIEVKSEFGGKLTVLTKNGKGTVPAVAAPQAPAAVTPDADKVQQAFSALDREAKKITRLNAEVSELRGTCQKRMDITKFRFCVPVEVLKNSADVTLALAADNIGGLRQKARNGENIEFELIITGVKEGDIKLVDALNERDDIKTALNLPKKFTVSAISETQIQQEADRLGYDISDPKGRAAIVKDFFTGTLVDREYMAIVTDAVDTEKEADDLTKELERDFATELADENISIRVPVKSEAGKSIYSLSKIINDWLEVIKRDGPSTIRKILPIPAPMTEELRKAMEKAWAVLIAA